MKLLIGGGDLLAKYAEYKKGKEEITVITSKRMMDSVLIDNKTFGERIKGLDIGLKEVESLDEEEVLRLMKRSQITISFASPWIFKQRHIDNCAEIVNVHLTELPKWKGAASISWKILCGERTGGTTIHRLTSEIDEGDILFQRRYNIPRN